tara:strand:+ start:5985 stop:6689 length:705 start_codon:yes stop_codon:yes gene_type:complete
MALPKINESPKYKVTIPSTGKVAFFRPFLVKEQKVLMMALESKDAEQIIRATNDTIASCIEGVDIASLATFDVDYIFLQIRSKSVGETSDITILCTECDAENKITLNIEDINIKVEHEVPEIVLTDKYTLKMRYPKYVDIVKTMINPDLKEVDKLFHTALVSLDSLLTENERILFDDETEEERLQFLDGLNSAQFEKIMEFVNAIPRLKKEIKFKCRSCEHDNNQLVEGIESFF